jgi:hypothetical protein
VNTGQVSSSAASSFAADENKRKTPRARARGLSYAALRSRRARRMHRLERIADGVFILAMMVMVAICAFLTYAISAPAHA